MVAEGKQRFMALFIFFTLPRSLCWKRKEPLSLTLPHDLDSPLQLHPQRVVLRLWAQQGRDPRWGEAR